MARIKSGKEHTKTLLTSVPFLTNFSFVDIFMCIIYKTIWWLALTVAVVVCSFQVHSTSKKLLYQLDHLVQICNQPGMESDRKHVIN